MNLKDRLKAYQKQRPGNVSRQADQLAGQHFTLLTTLFAVHPVSGEPLVLPPLVARDFAQDVAASDLLFFDLETTGLGSSEQVYPFLIGAALHEQTEVRLHTWFADTPAGEENILSEFVQLASGKVLVSFNGKSFDLPLVMRRCEKYGIKHGLARALHIDLFHTIRRIFPEKPARLTDAETRLLQFSRPDDISGAAVAQAYFEYLRFGRHELRAAILRHNESDVLSLVNLLARVSAAFVTARSGNRSWAYKIHRDKSASTGQKKQLLEERAWSELDGRDLHALGVIYRREKNLHRACRAFLAAYRRGCPQAIVDAVRCLRRLHGRSLSARQLARYGLAREDERIQTRLVPYGA
ncbi:MAG: ribonuclease H-like domain-containing protein [Spirochaetota bacterium]